MVRLLPSADGIDVNPRGSGVIFAHGLCPTGENPWPPDWGEGVIALVVGTKEGHIGVVRLLLAVEDIDVHIRELCSKRPRCS